ncbi:MAG: alpha/beta fold hydrolase, partial [bacterium]|nr:alpha/beta fold hydrolase [bacterium]
MTEPERGILRHGKLRFSTLAMGEGPLVLCLHGFPDNAGSFRHQLPALAEAGFRAVSVTLRGYEPSSLPEDGDYSSEALTRDVIAWLDDLNVDRAHLVGHDWGAAIAYTVGGESPERFHSLTTMAVPHSGRFLAEAMLHPKQLLLSWYMLFFQLRGLADYVVERNDYRFIERLWPNWSPGWDFPREIIEDVIRTLRAPGVKEAALGY